MILIQCYADQKKKLKIWDLQSIVVLKKFIENEIYKVL